MGRIEDNQWVDLIIDKIGSALVKVDESILKSIELWKDLTKDIYDDLPTRDTTRQPNNGKSGEEDSSQDKSVDEVKERPIQHWAMCASKIPERLIQELGDDSYFEVDWDHDDDDDDDDDEDDEKEEEKDDEGTVSESSDEDMLELTLGTSATSNRPNFHHHHNEEASGSSLKWKLFDGYEQLRDADTSSEEEDESRDDGYDEDDEKEDDRYKFSEKMQKIYQMRGPMGSCYLPPVHPLHRQNNALYMMRANPYHLSEYDSTSQKDVRVSESFENMLELNMGIHSQLYHYDRNEEDRGSSLRGRGGYELLKNDDMYDDLWDNEEEVMERMHKGDVEWLAGLVNDDDDDDEDGDEDEDEVSDKLQGFVDVKEEESVETVSSECDWVYVTMD